MLRPLTIVAAAAAAAVILALPAAAEPPQLVLPGSITAEASGPDGAVVTYSVSAMNSGGQPVAVNCDHASGSTFPIGTTVVTCSTVEDDTSTPATGSFSVIVQDTTAPTLSLPGDITATGTSEGATVEFVVQATDAVDGVVAASCTPSSGSLFATGTTRVDCLATDSHGNTANGSFAVTVETSPSPPPPTTTSSTSTTTSATTTTTAPTTTTTATPPSGTTTAPVPEAPRPPEAVAFTAARGRGVIRLRWTPPPGYDQVELSRVDAVAPAGRGVVYRGTATAFTDKGVREGRRYRYSLVVVASDGIRSSGLDATTSPLPARLLRPLDGAALRRAPELVWLPTRGATYYNVQLFRGATKVLSVWPRQQRLRLPLVWTYAGVRYRLTPGLYRWYVWPGFGPRRQRTYGRLIGQATFSVRP